MGEIWWHVGGKRTANLDRRGSDSGVLVDVADPAAGIVDLMEDTNLRGDEAPLMGLEGKLSNLTKQPFASVQLQ